MSYNSLKWTFFLGFLSTVWRKEKGDYKDPRCIEISTGFFLQFPEDFILKVLFFSRRNVTKNKHICVVLLVIQYIYTSKSVKRHWNRRKEFKYIIHKKSEHIFKIISSKKTFLLKKNLNTYTKNFGPKFQFL